MELKTFFAQDEKGNVVPGAKAHVYLTDTMQLAVDLHDRNGNALTNPFTADDNGQIQFAAPNGLYDLHVSSAGRDYIVPVKFFDAEDIGTLRVVAQGTHHLPKPDQVTLAEIARRVAMQEPARIAYLPKPLLAGENIVALADLVGDDIDPTRIGFSLKIKRDDDYLSVNDDAWQYNKANKAIALFARGGDELIAVELVTGNGAKNDNAVHIKDFITSVDIEFSNDRHDADKDCTQMFERALRASQQLGLPLDLGSGNYFLSGKTINALEDCDVNIRGNAGSCNVYCSGWEVKDLTKDQALTAHTQFSFPMQGENYSKLKRRLSLSGIRFINLDDSFSTRCVHASGCMDYLEVNQCEFMGFTAAGVFGKNITTFGIHPGSDAQTSINSASIHNVSVASDKRTTGQAPKSFHIHHSHNTTIMYCRFMGYGNGYVFRLNGGGFDTVPVVGRGSANVRFVANYVYTEVRNYEYCQITKTTNIIIANNTADASNGDTPHNFFDLFNCIGVSFYGNTVYGGGLLFHGHADLNHGKSPDNLIGSRGLTASGNVIINPTHYAVFNLGGDGTVDGGRAYAVATITGNSVYLTPDFTPFKKCYFIYAFVARDITVTANTVSGVAGFFRTFWSRNISIYGNTIKNCMDIVRNDGNDRRQIRFGVNDIGESKYDFAGQHVIEPEKIHNALEVGGDIKAHKFYTRSDTTEYVSDGSVVLDLDMPNEASLYLLAVTLGSYIGGQSQAMYMVSRSGDAGYVVPITDAIKGVVVAVDKKNGLSVRNVTGNRKKLSATAFRIQ
ncbi:hypothetical protein GCM10027040_29460 [Halomonas shantousis]